MAKGNKMKKLNFFLAAITLFCLLSTSVHATLKGNALIQSFNKAKKILLKHVYDNHRITFYCGCEYSMSKKITKSHGYVPKKKGKRAKRIEWEHIVPAHAFGWSFKEWREGHPDCVNRKGGPFKGRKTI